MNKIFNFLNGKRYTFGGIPGIFELDGDGCLVHESTKLDVSTKKMFIRIALNMGYVVNDLEEFGEILELLPKCDQREIWESISHEIKDTL